MSELRRRELLAGGRSQRGRSASERARCATRSPRPRVPGPPYGALGPPDANGLMLPPGFRSPPDRGRRPAGGGHGYAWRASRTARRRSGPRTAAGSSSRTPSRRRSTAAERRRRGSRPTATITDAYRILGGTTSTAPAGHAVGHVALGEELDDGHDLGVRPRGRAGGASRVPRSASSATRPRPSIGSAQRLYLTEDQPTAASTASRRAPTRTLARACSRWRVVATGGQVTWQRSPIPTTALSRDADPGQVPRRRDSTAARASGTRRRRLLHDEGRQEGLGVRHRRPRRSRSSSTRRRAGLARSTRSTTSRSARPATSSCARTAATSRSGSSRPERTVSPFLRFTGSAHTRSELCGVLRPVGHAPVHDLPARLPRDTRPARSRGGVRVGGSSGCLEAASPRTSTFGPPAGELRARAHSTPAPTAAARGSALNRPPCAALGLRARGLRVRVRVDEAADVALALTTAGLARRRGRGGSTVRPRRVELSLLDGACGAPGRPGPGARAHRPARARPPAASAQGAQGSSHGDRPGRRGQPADRRAHGAHRPRGFPAPPPLAGLGSLPGATIWSQVCSGRSGRHFDTG